MKEWIEKLLNRYGFVVYCMNFLSAAAESGANPWLRGRDTTPECRDDRADMWWENL